MQSELPQKLRPGTAGKMLGISKATLLRWEHEKADFPKPSRPTPRVTLYDRDQLLAFLEAHSTKQEQPA